jgi:DNA (cytosine-5)-methyltransferase 1
LEAGVALNVLDLFSGIGGFSLGLERAGMRTVAFCETDHYCRAVLRKHWPGVPIHGDVRELHAADVGPADFISGGFPCQDTSNAGSRRGLAGSKSGLWSEMRRLIAEIRPAGVLIENSAHGARHWVEQVCNELAALGMDATPLGIAASDLGANHERRRVYVLADACSRRHRLAKEALCAGRTGSQLHPWWAGEPGIPRVDDGLPCGVDRRRVLGNTVVPQIVELIGRAVMSAYGDKSP